MITKCVIYGERCSGTTYLENIIRLNFDVEFQSKIHFFGFPQEQELEQELEQEQELTEKKELYDNKTLVIGITRHPVKYMNSLFHDKWHIAPHLHDNIDNFLNAEFWSCNDTIPTIKSIEIMADRHIYTHARYTNIFELRDTKLRFLIEDMPNLVQNYILIKYEDLKDNFVNTVAKLQSMGLPIKKNIAYPVNTEQYKFVKKTTFVADKRPDLIDKKLIFGSQYFKTKYELQLGYIVRKI